MILKQEARLARRPRPQPKKRVISHEMSFAQREPRKEAVVRVKEARGAADAMICATGQLVVAAGESDLLTTRPLQPTAPETEVRFFCHLLSQLINALNSSQKTVQQCVLRGTQATESKKWVGDSESDVFAAAPPRSQADGKHGCTL